MQTVDDQQEKLGDWVIGIQDQLLLRLMIEAADEQAVAALIPLIGERLSDQVTISNWTGERYWKIPELFDITLELDPQDNALAAYETIIGMSAGWERYDGALAWSDQEAVWSRNTPGSGEFLHPRVEWSQIILNRYPILSEPPGFGVGAQVRICHLADDEDWRNELAGRIGTVQTIVPQFDGSYGYWIGFEPDNTSFFHEDEIAAA